MSQLNSIEELQATVKALECRLETAIEERDDALKMCGLKEAMLSELAGKLAAAREREKFEHKYQIEMSVKIESSAYLVVFECKCKAVVLGLKITKDSGFNLICDRHMKSTVGFPYILDPSCLDIDQYSRDGFKVYDFRRPA